MNVQEPFAQPGDLAPINVHLDGFGAWQKYLGTVFSDTMPGRSLATHSFGSPTGKDMTAIPEAGGEVFRRLVEQQIEFCRFLIRRCENYLDLPDRCARCRTPSDVAQLQFEFLNRMAAEYAAETAKLLRWR